IPSPRPVALLEKRLYGILQRSYLITEFLPHARSLAEYLSDPFIDKIQRDKVLFDLIHQVGALHQNGIYHADLKGGNILVGKDDKGPRIYFIDLEASRLHRRLGSTKKIRDITRLNRALTGLIQVKERLRWIRRYLEGQREFLGLEDRLIKKIEIHSRARLIKKVIAKGPSNLKELRYGVKKVLVIKLRYIGDALLVTPLLDHLRDAFPEASVSMLVNSGTEPVLYENPSLNEVLALDRTTLRSKEHLRFLCNIRSKQFDLVIDLTDADRSAFISYISGAPMRIGYYGKSLLRNHLLYNILINADEGALHKIDHHLVIAEAFGCPIKNRGLSLFLTMEEMINTKKKLEKKGLATDHPFVVFHPGARRWYKSWPAEYFSALGNMILEEFKIQLVLAGGPSDQEAVLKIHKGIIYPLFNLAGELDLRELGCLLKMAALCVVNDSSPMHMAAALETPTVALFGLTDWRNWYPRGAIHTVISRDCPCRPYGHRRECDQGKNRCMRKISVEEVFEAVKARLASPAKRGRLT
ncbi:MAG TPA: putative lipopolysaccharide heptosyltransferase III, partial [Nitrospiria bacterium]|nr:putative lipopolysaccharide heptosyltransferase III [Nitrospiria bacterium]